MKLFYTALCFCISLIVFNTNLKAQVGNTNGTYHFGSVGAANSHSSGFKTQQDKFAVSNDATEHTSASPFADYANSIYFAGTGASTAGATGSLTIKAESGSTCKTFTLKNLQFYIANSSNVIRHINTFVITLKNISGATIASHSISSQFAGNTRTLHSLNSLPFSVAYPIAGYTGVAEINLSYVLANGSNPATPGSLFFRSIVLEDISAGATEFFEDETVGNSTFTNSTINPFTGSLIPSASFKVFTIAGNYGYNSSANYIESTNANPASITSSSQFKVQSLYLYPSTDNGNSNQTAGVSVTFTGKLGGVTQFTYTPPAADFTAAHYNNAVNRGFSLVNFATPGYQNTFIDELVVDIGGSGNYIAIDNFTFIPSLIVAPIITTTGSLSAFSTCAGTASAQQSFTTSGSNLTANLVVTPPAGYEVSTTSGSGFASTVTLVPSSGTVATTTIYTRLTTAATGSPSGNITVASTGATTQNVAVSGTVNVLPTITLSTVAAVSTTATSFSLPFTATTGSPNQYSITSGTPAAMPSFSAVTNTTLAASPITVNIPASAANTYDFNLTVRNSITGCVSSVVPFTVAVNTATNLLTTLGINSQSPASAYSLRKLSSTYTGSAIQVRRSNDNATQNIGFTAGSDLDTASLKTFVGSGNGFITIWYDQSGNARNLTQTIETNQPAIINAGVIYRRGNKPTVFLDGSNDGMLLIGSDYLTANPLSVNLVAGSNSNSNVGRRAVQGSSVGNNWLVGPYTNAHTWFAGGFNHLQALPWSTTQVERFTIIQPTSNTNTSFRNGSSITTGNDKSTRPGTLNLGASGGFAEPLDGFISEVVSYASELNTTDRQSMETSQATYYNPCTPTPSTFTVAACGTYTWAAKGNKVYTASNTTDTIMLKNAAGCDSVVTLNLTITSCPLTTLGITNNSATNAYSVRKLTTAYTGFAIRVRRSSDNTTQDIGFTTGGDLDTAALKTFIGSNSGFVSIWYDQSGRGNNATNTNNASQPSIVINGVINRLKLNGNKPTITAATATNSLSFAVSPNISGNGLTANAVATMQGATPAFGRLVSLSNGNNTNDFDNNLYTSAIIRENANNNVLLYRNFTVLSRAQIALNAGTVITSTIDGPNYSIYANNQFLSGSFSPASNTNFEISFGRIFNHTNDGDFTTGWVGNASEVLLFATPLSTTDRQSMEASQVSYHINSSCSPSPSTFTVSACGTYTWAAKGNKVYTASNTTDTIMLVNAAGCDSIVTLNLTINAGPAINSITPSSVCVGSPITINVDATATQVQWQLNGTTVSTNNSLTAGAAITSTVAGTGSFGSGANQLSGPSGVFVDAAGNIYVAEQGNHRIQKWTVGDTTGTTVAGGNGLGSAANQFVQPRGVAVDAAGNIYVADQLNHRIQKWAVGSTTGTTVAGGNGQGIGANQLDIAYGVAIDAAGNIYVADQFNQRIQKFPVGSTTGTTVAGGNGRGSNANQLKNPSGVFVDAAGNIYVADRNNDRIQKWAVGATVGTTVAGGNGFGSAANQLNFPVGVFVDAAGSIYVADQDNNRIQKWPVGATTGTTVAGGNGSGSNANQLSNPTGLFVDAAGSIYVADQFNHRIQKVAAAGKTATFTPTQAGTYTAIVSNGTCSTTSTTLIVTAPTSSTFTVAACGTYTWAAKGNKVYTASNTTDTIMLKNAAGCDSIITLNLTINTAPTLSIATSGATTFCAGDSVTLTANLNAGSNNALQLNGSSYAKANPIAALNLTNNLSIEAWIKPSFDGVHYIVSKGISDFSSGHYGLLQLNNKIQFTLRGAANVVSTASITPGVYTHIAATYDGANMKLYINGVLDNSTAYSQSLVPNTDTLQIGRLGNPIAMYNFNGEIDELRIWNTAITTTEINNNKNAILPAATAGLVAYYRFSETTGTTTADASSNGNTATLVNTPSFVSNATALQPQATYTWLPGGATTKAIVAKANNTYKVTTNFNGCTATDSVVVNVNQPTVSTFTVAACGSYTWAAKGNKVYTASNNTDTIMLKNAAGCDSIVTLNLTINVGPTISSITPSSVCVGSPITINVDATATQVQWQLNGTTVSTNNSLTINSASTSGVRIVGHIGSGASAIEFNNPMSVVLDAAGTIYVADRSNHRIQKFLTGQTMGTTIAGGNGSGSALSQFSNPLGVALDGSGNVYIADQFNHRIQKWVQGATTGTTVAGGNGQGSNANQLNTTTGVVLDAAGNIYVADQANHRIQKWIPGATSGTTVAGGNGQGSAANQLNNSYGVAIDALGNIYVADRDNHRIQKWALGASTGTTIAGGNGQGIGANQLNSPTGVAVDAAGNIYVADRANHRIQKWEPGASTGTTVAGGNGQGGAPNQLNSPHNLTIDPVGNIYVADQVNHRIQKFAAATKTATFTPTLAGTYTAIVSNGTCSTTSSTVIVIAPTTSTFTVSACGSYTWVAKGNKVYTASNTTDTIILKNAAGCDSVVTLNLTINGSNCNTIWNGITWSNGTPTSTVDAVINSSVAPASFTCKALTINSGVALTTTGITATVNGNIVNNGNGIAGTGGLIINANSTISGNAISFNGALTVNTGATLTTGGLLTLASNAANTARVANSAGVIDGNVAVQRYIPGKRAWRFLTAPLSSNGLSPVYVSNSWQQQTHIVGPTGTGLDAVKPFYSMLTYNNAWQNVSNTTSTELFSSSASASNKPFATFVTGNRSVDINSITAFNNTTLSATGKLLQGTQTFNLGSLAANAYAFVGNPYASPVDLNLVYGSAGTSNINRTFYTWDPQLGTGLNTGAYVTISWNGGGYDIVPNTSTQTQHVQSGQAFFVQATAAAATNVSFEENDKSSTNTTTVFGAGNNSIDKLFINLQKEEAGSSKTIDGVLASFGANNSKGVNWQDDAEKLLNNEEGISINRNEDAMSIERRPYVLGTNDTIFFSLNRLTPNANYTLNLQPQNWDAGMQAVLIDKLLSTETTINLQQTNQYINFTSAQSNASDRFMVVFRGSGALPNRGFDVTGEKLGSNKVKINWEAKGEVGVRDYTLQKSADGVNYQNINTQAAKNGTTTSSYNYTDNNPVNGVNYYRVKTTQLNDVEQFSKVITINLNLPSQNLITVYPNPAINTVQISTKEARELRIVNVEGKVVYSKSINTSNAITTVDVSNFGKGVYMVEVISNNGDKQVGQFVVAR